MDAPSAAAMHGLSYLQLAAVLLAIAGGHLSVKITEGHRLSAFDAAVRAVTTVAGLLASTLLTGAAWLFLMPQSGEAISATVAGGVVCTMALAISARRRGHEALDDR